MNKYPSYQAKMKEMAQKKQKRAENFFLSLAAQLVLDESLYTTQKKMLEDRMNDALDRKDRDDFMECASLLLEFRNH